MNKLEVIIPKYFPFIFFRPKNQYECCEAEVFLDNKSETHFFDGSICGRYILYLDDIGGESNNLDIKYFKIKLKDK